MKRVLIKNGTVYDGLGSPGVKADVLLADGKVERVGRLDAAGANADMVIDAAGKTVCPGFVDIHRHCDAKPLNDPNFGDRELLQGITTTVVGNCGISLTPCPADDARAKEMYDFDEAVLGPIALDLPRTYEAYLKALKETKLPLNFASMVGTGAVKITVKGFSDTPYTKEELTEARDLIADAMKRGAAGISLGIMYLPECYSKTDEFAYILKPVGEYGRVITTHIRGEGDSMVESVQEVIEIAKKAGCALEISHFKSCGIHNWRKDIHRAVELIEKARAKGQDVTCDFYPYEGGSTALTTMLPPVFVRGDMTRALKALGTEKGVAEFRRLSRVPYDDWDNFCVTLGWERIIISGVCTPKFVPMLGMTVTEAAEKFGYADAESLAADLMHTEDGKTAIINMSMCQDDIDFVAKLPYSNVISDAIYADTDTPHPRMYGAFPKIIREYVRERGLYTMEEAIHKMTGQPAARMKLTGRGTLTEGSFADVLIFDPAEFCDHATFTDPARPATGLSYLFLNGEMVIEKGKRLPESRYGVCILAE
ncbi:MAG: D-aminoacylase [Lachnospiraceae bacterium]|nr:D-aminoacylase [Lachnospiraceae bacterium]